jgi:hypothetical protein
VSRVSLPNSPAIVQFTLSSVTLCQGKLTAFGLYGIRFFLQLCNSKVSVFIKNKLSKLHVFYVTLHSQLLVFHRFLQSNRHFTLKMDPHVCNITINS